MSNAESIIYGKRSAPDSIRQRLSRHQLHNQKLAATEFFNAVDCRNVRMIQRSQNARFTFKSRDTFGIIRECLG